MLQALLEHPGALVTRKALRNRLWGADTFVDFEVGLNAAVRRLREALKDSAHAPRYIETLPRRGYRFIAAVEGAPTVAPSVRLQLSAMVVMSQRWRSNSHHSRSFDGAGDAEETADARSDTHVRSPVIQITMKDWLSEEQIKAQLRELTDETRKLRNDLYQLIRPSKASGTRAFIHDRAGRPADQKREGASPEIRKIDEEI